MLAKIIVFKRGLSQSDFQMFESKQVAKLLTNANPEYLTLFLLQAHNPRYIS